MLPVKEISKKPKLSKFLPSPNSSLNYNTVSHVLSITELLELDPLPTKDLELPPLESKEIKPEKLSLPDLMKKKNEFIENFSFLNIFILKSKIILLYNKII